MRLALAMLVVLAVQPALRGIDGLPQGLNVTDLDDLLIRVSESVYVIKGRVLESRFPGSYSAPVSGLTDQNRIRELLERSRATIGEQRAEEAIKNAARTEPLNEKEIAEITKKGGVVLMETHLGGTLYTIAVDQVLCRQSDFFVALSQIVPPSGPVYIFVPPEEGIPAFDAEKSVGRDQLAPDGEYLLFLRPDSPGAEVVARYKLDPSLTYYRAYQGHRGAVRLPDAAEAPYSLVTPLVSAVTTYCAAVKPADAAAKIRNLNAVRDHSTDPAWHQSVDAAIWSFRKQQSQPPRPPE